MSDAPVLTASQKKTRALEDIHEKYGDRDSDLGRTLREKEEELEVYKAGMDDALLQLNELRLVGKASCAVCQAC